VLGLPTPTKAASILETYGRSRSRAAAPTRATRQRFDSYTLEREQARRLPDSPTERNLLATFSDAVEAGDTAAPS